MRMTIELCAATSTARRWIRCRYLKGGEALDTKKLKGKIVENGDTQAQLAAAIGISPSNLNDKINGKVSFRQAEIAMIKERYHLSAVDVDAIFFSM